MTTQDTVTLVSHADRLFIDGAWVAPSSDAMLDVVDSGTEEVFLSVAEARPDDMERAIEAARRAFDDGPWPRMSMAERIDRVRALGTALKDYNAELAELWSRQSGIVHPYALGTVGLATGWFDAYIDLAENFDVEEPVALARGAGFGLRVREPVGVVGAIVPWNAPLPLMINKVAPALLTGCTVVLKLSPEAPGEGYLLAEAARQARLPAGVLNVLTADRAVSEMLVTDSRIDKIAFTGSTAAGQRIASLCGERIARFTLELGGKSAAVILDDADIESAAATLAASECFLTGQVCTSLTRIVIARPRHDQMVEALANAFGSVTVGNAFDAATQMGPLAMQRQRERVEAYIAAGVADGATLATGGARPAHLPRGWYVEPTVFGNVDNGSSLAQEEIFGPVLAVIPATDDADAVRIANDTVYGLNASVFTADTDRAHAVARQLRSGTVGHNAMSGSFEIGAGGFKQSGIGREGGIEGLLDYVETKAVILREAPGRFVTS